MKLIISKEVRNKFPDIELVLLEVSNVTVSTEKKVIQESRLRNEIKNSSKANFFEHLYFVALRKFYREIGLSPEIEPPAAENLYRNYIRKGTFSQINNVVDCSNLVSIQSYVPLGVFDTDKIEGDLVLRYSEEGEIFKPIGGRTEILPKGVVVISDSKKLFSKFPYRDSIFGAVSNNTKNILIIGDKVKGFKKEDVEKAVQATGSNVVTYAGGIAQKISYSTDQSEKNVVSYVAPKQETKGGIKRVFSGIRATGRLHLGNYLGAVKGMLDLQNSGKYETIYCVVDVHSITTPYQVEELRKNKREIIIDYLAAGLDPKKSILIYQSDVPEHIELAFYFSTVTTVARMLHLPTYKDKIKQYPKNVTVALLNYPVLMAADILIYKACLVPVGIDQEPHLEVAREVARKMNQVYGTDFLEPVRFATKGEYIPSLKGEGKMSKTVEGSYINLTDSLEVIRKKIRSVPTATKSGGEMNPGIKTLFTLVNLFIPAERDRLEKEYNEGALQFVSLKDTIADVIYKELQPFQKRRDEIVKDQAYVDKVIKEGAEKARAIASKTVQEVKEKMGLA